MIELINISKYYPKSSTHSLKDVCLAINAGDIFGIIGYSGAGKSTLLRTINYLEPPSSGSVIVDGVDLSRLNIKQLSVARKNIGMIFQNSNLLSSKSIFKNVALPLELNKTPKSLIKKRVNEVLNLVGLEGFLHKYPNELSGGQKQRVGIARALVTNPKVLLCDEPTSALDTATTYSILELLKQINKTLNITVVIITHEIDVVQALCNKMAVINKGEIVEEGLVKTIFNKPKSPITKLLLAHILNGNEDCNCIVGFNVTPQTPNLNFINNLVTELKTNISIINSYFYEENNHLHGSATFKIKLNKTSIVELEKTLLNFNLEITELTEC